MTTPLFGWSPMMSSTAPQKIEVDLAVELGRLRLPNPILTASGTFGYAREMAGIVDLQRLGGILPKTITRDPRPGNPPWRTVETTAGLLNAWKTFPAGRIWSIKSARPP